MKTEERFLARQLRKEEGLSIGKIASRLGVSKSSVSLWVRDIELTNEQWNRLQAKGTSNLDGSCSREKARVSRLKMRLIREKLSRIKDEYSQRNML